MKLEGTFPFAGPRATVWALLHDPAVLAKALPGTKKLELAGPASEHLDPRGLVAVEVAVRLQPPDALEDASGRLDAPERHAGLRARRDARGRDTRW